MKWVTIGAVLGGLGVAIGAFGAHGLPDYFAEKYSDTEAITIAGQEVPAPTKYLDDFKTGARYHMYHAFAILIVGLLSRTKPSRALEIAGWLFLVGILLFSGALYVLAIGGPRWMGVIWGIIPAFGGLAMIAGWLALACGACPCCSRAEVENC